MFNRGFFNKGYHYEVIQLRLDKSGSFEGHIDFPTTFDTTPFVVVIPHQMSSANISVSNVTTSGFDLKIEHEGIITVKDPSPELLTFSNVTRSVAFLGQIQTEDLIQEGDTAELKVYLSRQLMSISIVDGGTGYAVGDRLGLIGGTYTFQFVLRVTSVDENGAITAVTVHDAPGYQVFPDSPYQFERLSGNGSGAVIVPTFGHFEISRIEIVRGGSQYDPSRFSYVISPNPGQAQLLFQFNESGTITGVTPLHRGSYPEIVDVRVLIPPPPPVVLQAYGTARERLEGEGFVECFVPSGDKHVHFGLSTGLFEPTISPIRYAFRLSPSSFSIVEGNHVYTFQSLNPTHAHALRIERKDGQIRYYVDEQLIYLSTSIPQEMSYSIFYWTTTSNLLLSSIKRLLYHKDFNYSSREVVSSLANQYVKYIYFAHEKL
ncbi:MAG: H-type lectin domain-containing protein [Chloroherpetonaceae bacterium]|nr:H-type lectin domain-containing protein [Chloroherpetonaceae bacterium]